MEGFATGGWDFGGTKLGTDFVGEWLWVGQVLGSQSSYFYYLFLARFNCPARLDGGLTHLPVSRGGHTATGRRLRVAQRRCRRGRYVPACESTAAT